MKRYLTLAVGLGVLSTLSLLFIVVHSTKELASSSLSVDPSVQTSTATTNVLQGIPADAKVLTPRVSASPPVQVVTHSGKDFAWGTFERTVLKEHLQLSPEVAAGVATGKPVSGTFTSPQHLGHSSFDSISFAQETQIPTGSSLNLDLRLLIGGSWTDWQTIRWANMDQPTPIKDGATAWQYRLTFSAPAAASSPEVKRITVTTRYSQSIQETTRRLE